MEVHKGDFVKIDYTGTIVDENAVFDTTSPDVAKKNNMDASGASGPVVICIGEGHVLRGLDEKLDGAQVGKEYTDEFKPENAFGKKNAKLLRLIPQSKFKSQGVTPQPNLQINIDGTLGTVRTVTGGRVIVDFNHPLSGRILAYTYKIVEKIEDTKEKIAGLLKLIGFARAKIELQEYQATISLSIELPPESAEQLKEDIIRMIPVIKEITFKK